VIGVAFAALLVLDVFAQAKPRDERLEGEERTGQSVCGPRIVRSRCRFGS
jgi:hypothetical protein